MYEKSAVNGLTMKVETFVLSTSAIICQFCHSVEYSICLSFHHERLRKQSGSHPFATGEEGFGNLAYMTCCTCWNVRGGVIKVYCLLVWFKSY